MRRQIAAGIAAGALALFGAGCEDDNPTSETEDISPELDEGTGEEGLTDEEE